MSQTVLVADDSKTIRQIVEMALKASAWEVVGVDSAQDAIQAARQNPSVILLDYYMPDGSGYDVCRALKSDAGTSGIPIVMLGGTYKNFDEALATQAGADGVLMKPFDTSTLIEAIENAEVSAAAPAPTPEPDSEPEVAYGYGEESSVPDLEPEPVYEAPTPAYEAPTPEPAYEAPTPSPDPTPMPTPTPSPDRQPTPTPSTAQTAAPNDATPMPTSSPRIDASTHAAPAPAGPSREEIQEMIRDEVKATVRAELPGLLRNVMGEIFQQKVLPKLMEHAEQRVKAVVSENLAGQIQNQVRAELERLLDE